MQSVSPSMKKRLGVRRINSLLSLLAVWIMWRCRDTWNLTLTQTEQSALKRPGWVLCFALCAALIDSKGVLTCICMTCICMIHDRKVTQNWSCVSDWSWQKGQLFCSPSVTEPILCQWWELTERSAFLFTICNRSGPVSVMGVDRKISFSVHCL